MTDDRGQAVNEALTVCFQPGSQECTEVKPGADVPTPAYFTRVQVEGAHHGPVSARPQDVRVEGTQAVLRVPRKALLRVEHLPAEPLTLSAFRPNAESFRTPLFSGVVEAGGILVPSGDLVLALAVPGSAPDLQRLTAAPGAQVPVTYHPRPGWSLLLRCKEAAGGAPVSGANVSLGRQSTTTGSDGLALLPGLQELESLHVQHPRYISQDLPAPPATVGAFLANDVLLEKGGSLAAHITVNDNAATGTHCTVVAAQGGGEGALPVAEGTVAADGFFRRRMPSGSYVLRIAVPQGQSFVEEPFEIQEGQEARLDVALHSLHVAGRVLRNGSPADGYTVEISPEGGEPGPPLQAFTNESGQYQTTLWVAGDYLFRVRADFGVLLGEEKRVSLSRPDEVIDFDLKGIPVTGRAMDDEGYPVEGAEVTLRGAGADLTAVTTKDGLFQFLVADAATAEVSVAKKGYDTPPSQQVSVGPGGQLDLLTFVLKRR